MRLDSSGNYGVMGPQTADPFNYGSGAGLPSPDGGASAQGWKEVPYGPWWNQGFSGLNIPPLSNYPTHRYANAAGGWASSTPIADHLTFGPVTGPGGIAALQHTIQYNDPRRYSGNRSGVLYDGTPNLRHGVDHWVALALYMTSSGYTQANSGTDDRLSFFDTHQINGGNANPLGLQWQGSSNSHPGLNIVTAAYAAGGGGALWMYRIASPALDTWTRNIIHFRSGPSGCIVEWWQAVGTGSYAMAPAGPDSNTLPWGDSNTGGSGTEDGLKIETYKWTSGDYGSMPTRTNYTSDLFYGAGTDRYNNAAASIAAYAI